MDTSAKKTLYGLFFILIAAAIMYPFAAKFFAPAPSCEDGMLNQDEEQIDCGGACASCAIATLDPLRVSREPKIITSPGGISQVYAEITNPNPDYKAALFAYSISFYDRDGREIQKLEDVATAGAGERTRIVKNGVTVSPSAVLRMEVGIGEPVWEESFPALRPDVSVASASTSISGAQIRISGKLKNQSANPGSSVRVIGILLDQYGKELFASETTLVGIGSYEERTFLIAFPADERLGALIDPSKTRTFVEAE